MDEGALELYLSGEMVLHTVAQDVRQMLLEDIAEDLRAGEQVGGEDHQRTFVPLVALTLSLRAAVATMQAARDLGWEEEDVEALKAMCRRWLTDAEKTLGAIEGGDIPEAFRRAFGEDD
jgi:hypothetical protein